MDVQRQILPDPVLPEQAGTITIKGTVPMERLFALFAALSLTTLQFAATVA
jgi:hypothetical protein